MSMSNQEFLISGTDKETLRDALALILNVTRHEGFVAFNDHAELGLILKWAVFDGDRGSSPLFGMDANGASELVWSWLTANKDNKAIFANSQDSYFDGSVKKGWLLNGRSDALGYDLSAVVAVKPYWAEYGK